MKMTIGRITRTAMLAVAFMLCATGQAWADAPTPVVVWDGEAGSNYDFSQLTKVAANGATYSINNVNTSAANNSSANYRASDNSYLQIVNSDNGYQAITITATEGTNPFGSNANGTTVIMRTVDMPVTEGSNRALITLLHPTSTYGKGGSGNSYIGVCRAKGANYGSNTSGAFLRNGAIDTDNGGVSSDAFSASRQDVTMTYKQSEGLKLYVNATPKLSWACETSAFAPKGVCLGGLDYTNSGWFYSQKGMKIIAVAIFDYSLSADEIAAYKFPFETMISTWSDRTIKAWRTPTAQGNFHQGTFAPISSSGVIGTVAQLANNEFHKFIINDTTSGNAYVSPGIVVVYDRPGYRQSSESSFSSLSFGGILVNSLQASDSPYTITGSGDRSVYLGQDNYTTYFTFNESYVINRTLDRAGATHIKGTVNMSIADGKYFDCNSQQANATWKHHVVLDANATLKISGAGKLKVSQLQATNSGATIDCSALGTEPATKFIEGTLVVNDNTKFKFPSGVIFPYKIATDISDSTTEGNQTFYIGETEYTTGHLVYDTSAGTVTAFRPTDISYTMSSNKTWAEVCGEGDTSDVFCDLHVTANSELTVTGSTAIKQMCITVDSGVELKIVNGGSGALSVTDGIVVLGSGKVTPQITVTGTVDIGSNATVNNKTNVYAANFKGSGTIIFDGVEPTNSGESSVASSAKSSASWSGTLWLKNYDGGGLCMPYWGNANSKIKFTNVKGYLPANGYLGYDGTTFLSEWILEDEVVDGVTKHAFTKTNGFSGYTVYFKKLSGSGTLAETTDQTPIIVIKDASEFSGTFNISKGIRIVVGDDNTGHAVKKIVIHSGKAATISSGKTWTATEGILVKGTLNVEGTTASKISVDSTGILNIGGAASLTGALTINGEIRLGAGASVPSIVSGSTGTLKVVSGAAEILAVNDSVLPTKIIIASNAATLKISDTTVTSLTIPADSDGVDNNTYYNAGTLDLSDCESLTTLCLELGDSLTFDLTKVSLPESCTTIKYVVRAGESRALPTYAITGLNGESQSLAYDIYITETREEYGKGNLSISNVPSGATVHVARKNGTSATAIVTDGVARLASYGTVGLVGAACWHDWEFNGNLNDDAPDGFTLSHWGAASVYTAEGTGDNKVLNLTSRDGTDGGLGTMPTEWSAAIRCTVPSNYKGWVIAFGSQGGGAIGLAAGETAGQVMLVNSKNASEYAKLADMPVASPTTKYHVYVFVKTADSVTTYCDGELINRELINKTIVGSFQLGTMIAGTGALSNAADGNRDYLRLYDYVLSGAQIEQLANDNPYESSTPTFSRTVSGEEDWSDTDAWTKSTDSSSQDSPDSDGQVEITASGDSTLTLNFASMPIYEKFTVEGSGAVHLACGAEEGKISAVKLVVDTDLTVDYNAVDFSGTRVSVGAGKKLTFDLTTYDWSSVETTTVFPVTGVVSARGDDESYDDRFGIEYGTLPNYISSVELVYNPDSFKYAVTITPDHDVGGEIYWREGTYWSADNENSAVFYTDAEGSDITSYRTGDILVIPDNSTRWYGPVSDGARLKFDCGGKVTIKKTGSLGYAFKNATITVESGTTLDFQKDGYSTNPEVYGGVISGAGSVSVGSGITLNMTNGAMVSASVNGAGVVSFDTLPTSALSLGSWTGTVVLPSFTASSGWSLNDYGKSGSTVEILGISGGWISEAGRTVAPTLKLTGNIVISAMSSWTYTFTEITGSGNLSFATTGSQPSSVTISKVAAGYTGTISSTLTTPVAITTLERTAEQDKTAGSKLLTISGNFNKPGTVTIGTTPLSSSLVRVKSDGIYIVYGTIFSVW